MRTVLAIMRIIRMKICLVTICIAENEPVNNKCCIVY